MSICGRNCQTFINFYLQEVRKAEEKAKRDLEAEEATRKRAEEAKKVTISEDKSLPVAEKVKISHLEPKRGDRVKVRH